MIAARLKDSTRELHERVERSLDVVRRTSSLDSYRALLLRFFGLYEPLEERLSQAPGIDLPGVDFARRRKTALLAEDLSALGFNGEDVAHAPRCALTLSLPTPAATLGCLYVVEGSTLGGQYIRRHVAKSLGLNADDGCCFFSSYGDQLKAMWEQFHMVLAETVGSPEAETEALAAAEATFLLFESWLKSRDE